VNIYSIRDRLLDYYGNPFMGPSNNAVLAAVATNINSPESKSDYAQAPQHFEVWKLGEINENGDVKADKELLADCNSLIRPGVRGTAEQGTGESNGTARQSQGEARRGLQPTNAKAGPTQDQA